MITEEKISEIRKHLRKGIPGGELREGLIREGYSEEDIRKAFAPKPYDMRSWYLGFAILLLLAGVYQVVNRNGYLLLALSTAMFFQYYRETARLRSSVQQPSSESPGKDMTTAERNTY